MKNLLDMLTIILASLSILLLPIGAILDGFGTELGVACAASSLVLFLVDLLVVVPISTLISGY